LFFLFASCSGSFFARVPDLQLALGAGEGAFGVTLVGTSVGTLAALTFAGPIMERVKNRSRRDLKPIRIRQSADLSNRLEQDHRAIKRRVRPMLGFQSMVSAGVILGGIEMIHMMRKQQAKYGCNRQPSLAEQFHLLAA
jgi:hypothetical protein